MGRPQVSVPAGLVSGMVRSGEEASCLLSGQGGCRSRHWKRTFQQPRGKRQLGQWRGALHSEMLLLNRVPVSLEPQLCPPLCGAFVLTQVARRLQQVHSDDVGGRGSKVSHLEMLSS